LLFILCNGLLVPISLTAPSSIVSSSSFLHCGD
jgi:hypothetical protein